MTVYTSVGGKPALIEALVDESTTDETIESALAAMAGSIDPADAVRTEQILWFYFGTGAWTTVRELGWDWPEAADWLATQAIAALLV